MKTIFETNRCIVRPFEEPDMDAFINYRNNLSWMKYQGFKGLSKEEYVKTLVVPFNIENHSQLAIVYKHSQTVIGDLYVRKYDDFVHIGYTINPEYSRKGLTYEAAQGMIKYIKEKYPDLKIKSGVDKRNIPSIKLLEKLHFVHSGETDDEYEYEYIDWMYDHDEYDAYRYTLGVRGINPLITFGINPSTAAPGNLDPTVKNTEKLSRHLNRDGWIMLNIYPQRSTDPNGMDLEFKKEEHFLNLGFIEEVFRTNRGSYVVAAWGNLINKRSYLIDCLEDIYKLSMKYDIGWKCIEINKTGHPKHPLYVSIPKVVLKDFCIQSQYHFDE